MYDFTNGIALFRRALPFYPSERQVIYVESDYDKDVNDFILNNYDWLSQEMENLGYEFCYFPAMSKRIQSWQYRRYYTPYSPPPITHDGERAIEPHIVESDCLSSYLKRGCILSSSFIVYDEDESDSRYYAFRKFHLGESKDLKSTVSTFLNYLSELKERYLERLASIRYCNTELIEIYPDEENLMRIYYAV